MLAARFPGHPAELRGGGASPSAAAYGCGPPPLLDGLSYWLQFKQYAVITAVQKMGAKGQVTLPKRVREALGLKAGDLLETVRLPDPSNSNPKRSMPSKRRLPRRRRT